MMGMGLRSPCVRWEGLAVKQAREFCCYRFSFTLCRAQPVSSRRAAHRGSGSGHSISIW